MNIVTAILTDHVACTDAWASLPRPAHGPHVVLRGRSFPGPGQKTRAAHFKGPLTAFYPWTSPRTFSTAGAVLRAPVAVWTGSGPLPAPSVTLWLSTRRSIAASSDGIPGPSDRHMARDVSQDDTGHECRPSGARGRPGESPPLPCPPPVYISDSRT